MLRPRDFQPVVLPALRWAGPREVGSLAFIPQRQDSDPQRPGTTPRGNCPGRGEAPGRDEGRALWDFRDWRRGKRASESAVTWCAGSPGPQRGMTRPHDQGRSRAEGGDPELWVSSKWRCGRPGRGTRWEPGSGSRQPSASLGSAGGLGSAWKGGRGCGLASGGGRGWRGYWVGSLDSQGGRQ